MKNYYPRICVALACAFGVAACGGGGRDVQLYVNVSGVTQAGLTLTNNGGEPVPVPAGAATVLMGTIKSDSHFDIDIATPAPNALCKLTNDSGKTGDYSPNNILLECTAYTYELGGTIKNLKSDGLILINGADNQTIKGAANTTGDEIKFSMTIPEVPATATTALVPATGKIAEGRPYGVLIYQQPTQGGCVIEKDPDTGISTGVGVMPKGDVTSIIIQC